MTTAQTEGAVPGQPVAQPRVRRRDFSLEANHSSRKTLKGRNLLLEDSDSDNESRHVRRYSAQSEPAHAVPTLSFQEIISSLDIEEHDQKRSSHQRHRSSHLIPENAVKHSKVGSETYMPSRRRRHVSASRAKELPELPQLTPRESASSDERRNTVHCMSSGSQKRASAASTARSSMLQDSFVSSIDTEGLEQADLDALKVLKRRQAILRELVLTELSFSEDMAVVVQEYQSKTESCAALNAEDVRQIFGGVEPVLSFSSDFSFELQTSAAPVLFSEAVSLDSLRYEDSQVSVGAVFGQFMSRLSKVFSRYCSTHENAALRLQKVSKDASVQSWLSQRHPADRTTAWDLPSLLIKPVQRIMKYPLLLSTLLEATPRSHADYYAIELGLKEMLFTAENINNIKKRRDIVGAIAADRKKTDIGVLAKTFQRRTTKIKQALAPEDDQDQVDVILGGLAQNFRAQSTVLQNLKVEIDEWLNVMKSSLEFHAGVALAFENVRYCRDTPASSMLPAIDWNRYTQAVIEMQAVLNTLKRDLDDNVHRSLSLMETSFQRPALVLAKRDSLVDSFLRARANRSKGSISDNDLLRSADEYVSLNDTLIQELPTFLECTRKAMNIVVGNLAGIQSKWYESWSQHFQVLVHRDALAMDIKERFRDREALMLVHTSELDLTNGKLAAANRIEQKLHLSEDDSSVSDVSSKVSSLSLRPTVRNRALSVATTATTSFKNLSSFGRSPSGSTTPTLQQTRNSIHSIV